MSDRSKMVRHYKETRARLHELYPAAFCAPNVRVPVPLKVGIHDDLVAAVAIHGIKPKWLRSFLYVWTHRNEYLIALARGGARHALDGSVAGQVTPGEAVQAGAAMAAMAAKRKATRSRCKSGSASAVKVKQNGGCGGSLQAPATPL